MIEGLPIASLGPSALLGIVVLMILTDRLVPRNRLREVQKENAVLRETNAELLRQNGLMLDSSIPTVNAVLGALHDAAEMGTSR